MEEGIEVVFLEMGMLGLVRVGCVVQCNNVRSRLWQPDVYFGSGKNDLHDPMTVLFVREVLCVWEIGVDHDERVKLFRLVVRKRPQFDPRLLQGLRTETRGSHR